MNNFKIQNYISETVKYFCYLGVKIRYICNINASSSQLMEKGRKVYLNIKKCVGFDNPYS